MDWLTPFWNTLETLGDWSFSSPQHLLLTLIVIGLVDKIFWHLIGIVGGLLIMFDLTLIAMVFEEGVEVDKLGGIPAFIGIIILIGLLGTWMINTAFGRNKDETETI